MRGFRMAVLAGVTVLSLQLLGITTGCGSAQPTTSAPPTTSTTSVGSSTTASAPVGQPSSTTTMAVTTSSSLASPSSTSETVARGSEPGDFSNAVFSEPTKIDNTCYPMQPGTQLVYEGYTEEENGDRVAHRVVFTVTDLTKVINGVQSVILWDRDFADGELEETELAFFAQDDDRNVWQMGEYPEAYEDGKLVEALAWIPGILGAEAGIIMQADPQPGRPSYSEGWGPAVDWADRGQVTQTGVSTTVAAGAFDDVVVIKEYSDDEPGAFQLKYYAPGVGVIRVGWGGTDDTKETLELTQIVHLDAAGLVDIRAQALKLEQHAYKTSKDVYALTAPAK